MEVPQGVFCGVGKNVARGITPTVSDWDTSPSNLERVTDGDLSTVTGTGQTTLGAAGTAGILKIDFDRPVTGFVIPYFGYWTDGVTGRVYLDQYVNGSLYYATLDFTNTGATTEQKKAGFVSYLTESDAIRFRFYLSSAGTLYAKFYEVAVFEVVL